MVALHFFGEDLFELGEGAAAASAGLVVNSLMERMREEGGGGGRFVVYGGARVLPLLREALRVREGEPGWGGVKPHRMLEPLGLRVEYWARGGRMLRRHEAAA
jgi:hypothetical protein